MTSSEPAGREDPISAYRRLSAVRQRLDEDAFRPSGVIERLVLQVIGGWEQVRAELNFHSFAAAGPSAEWTAKNPATAMNKITKAARVRYPHDEFSTVANDVNEIRRRFAHLLALGDTVGEFPNRTLQFMRLGDPAKSYRPRGKTGLKWRDEAWAMQAFHQDSISEQELRDALEKEHWMIHVVRAADRLAGILAASPDLPDDRKIL